MKVDFHMPQPEELAALLEEDPLRNLMARAAVGNRPPAEFTRELGRRLDCARLDPRVFESCVERLALFPQRLDFNVVAERQRASPWGAVWPLAADFAARLTKGEAKEHLFYLIAATRSWRGHPSADRHRTLESFYFGLHRPGTARSERALVSGPRLWRRYGYWAGDEPYSKELRAWSGAARADAPLTPLTQIGIIETLRSCLEAPGSPRWQTLAQLHADARTGLSRRQLLRWLERIPGLRRQGARRGTRYAIASRT
jgi:hypothetical protein